MNRHSFLSHFPRNEFDGYKNNVITFFNGLRDNSVASLYLSFITHFELHIRLDETCFDLQFIQTNLIKRKSSLISLSMQLLDDMKWIWELFDNPSYCYIP